MKELRNPKDRFHTYRTRSCANIRDRIKVESAPYDDEMIGTEKFKAKSKMATDIDEYYQKEIYHERSRESFCSQPISLRDKLRETLRIKMDVYWMKEKMILDHVQELKQEKIIEEIISEMKKYDEFLTDYKKESYRKSIEVMHEVKNYYQESDRLRKIHEDLQAEIEPLKMKIFFHGIDFVRLTIIQNFQYLMKPLEWRRVHDYIHKTPQGELESVTESINNREKTNLWNRDNVTVYVIRDFIENVYLKKNQEILPVFDNGIEFLKIVKELNSSSTRWLIQYHLAAHTLNDVEMEFFWFEQNNGIEKLNQMVQVLSKKRIFMEFRSKQIREIAEKIINKPFEESFSAEKLHNLRGICHMMYKTIVAKTEEASKADLLTSVDKLAAVERKIFELFSILDQIPSDLRDELDKEIKRERKKKLAEALRASKIETSVHHRLVQLQRSLAKPPKKEKRQGKLPMSVLPVKSSKPKVAKPLLTPIEEAYYRAFTELGPTDGEIQFDKSVKQRIDRIKNESIPFYLDHYLDVNLGVKLPKESVEEDEKIFIEEAASFKFPEVLPEVRHKVKLWERNQEKLKRENIRKTPHLYQ